MKISSHTLFASLTAGAMLAGLALHSTAQDQKKKQPQTWEEKKAEKLKPLTDEQKAQIEAAVPKKATAKPAKDRKVLVFYRCEGFIHTSITSGNYALQAAAKSTGAFSVDLADTYDVFTKENLAQYDLILLNNTTNMVMPSDEHRAALVDFVESGKGIAGIHAASDNFKQWAEGVEIMGGVFTAHPWTAGGNWAFRLDDPTHPLNKAFGKEGFWHTDEIYWYKPESFVGKERLRLLVSLDFTKPENLKPLENERYTKDVEQRGGIGAVDVPVSWVREIGKGRLFYTNFGHRDDTYSKPAVMQHIVDGMQYAMGDLKADATPTAKLGKVDAALAPSK